MTDLIENAHSVIAEAFDHGVPVYIAFSGGKDSVALLDLCREHEGRFKLLWVNTGFAFPHVETFIREAGERYGLVELRSDLVAHWRAFGLPAKILPVDNALGDGCHKELKLQPWVSCCSALRARPILEFMAAQTEPIVILHGQRRSDRVPGLGLAAGLAHAPHGSHVIAPLAEWTTDHVIEYLAHAHVPLPAHYETVPDSLDCWNCPAAFSETHAPALVDYMAEHYPDYLRIVLPGVKRIHAASAMAVGRLGDVIDRARPKPSRKMGRVSQRTIGVGDCVIAALATCLGQSYETIAATLGYPCDDAGKPSLGKAGISLLEIPAPLLSLGVSATILLSRDAPPELSGNLRLPSSDELKVLLRGRTAVLMVDEGDEASAFHAFAWRDGMAIDCRMEAPPDPVRIEDLTLTGVVLLNPTWSRTHLSRRAKSGIRPHPVAVRSL